MQWSGTLKFNMKPLEMDVLYSFAEKTHPSQCFHDWRAYLWESCNQSLQAFSGSSGCGQSAHSPASPPTTAQTLETDQPKAALVQDFTDSRDVFSKATACNHKCSLGNHVTFYCCDLRHLNHIVSVAFLLIESYVNIRLYSLCDWTAAKIW